MHARIELWGSRGVGIIIPCPSGVIYTNQTAGYACHHPETEGVYLPLNDDYFGLEHEWQRYFTGPKWGGWCEEGIDAETADFIEALLDRSFYGKQFRVDRTRLAESEEAWVHVLLPSPQDDKPHPFSGFTASTGILTWENSD